MSTIRALPGGPSDQNGITITYAGAESLLDSPAFGQFLSAFSSQLPLRNLHWKPTSSWPSSSTSGPASPLSAGSHAQGSSTSPLSIRTIQTLNTRLQPMSDILMRAKLKPETRHLIQRSLLERPFCHLYFVVGDDSDAYRNHIRNDIRTWLSTIQSTPTLSAATVTARSVQAFDPAHVSGTQHNGSSTPRSQTPPVGRPGTPTRSSLSTEDRPTSNAAAASSSKDKDKPLPPSPEYLVVVITPPEGSPFASPLSSSANQGRSSPALSTGSAATPTSEAPARTGLQRFMSSGSSNSSSTNSASKSASGVVEKVKADFNTSRKERVVHLTRLPKLTATNDAAAKDDTPNSRRNHSDPTIFAELILRIKESVTSTFDAVVGMQDEAVRKELEKREVPGWNYNKWMASMECLAHTFELTGLHADALTLYEEIEALFQQCMVENRLPYFTHVGGREEGDDSATLLDINKKDYRDLIIRNDISLFDFRNYLFAKRAQLLGRMGRIAQVMSETPGFLSRIAVMLRDETLAPHFVESWTFSSAIDVVEQCQAWLVERGDVQAPGMENEDLSQAALRQAANRIADSQLSASFHAAKAELLDLARRQLDKIGMEAGHLPRAMPFSLSAAATTSSRKNRDLPPLPHEASESASSKQKITRRELVEALENREVFDLRYVALSERILAGWISSGRRRNVLRLRCILASVDYFRGRYAPALNTFASMTETYSEGRWTKIESTLLARQLFCHENLERPKDRAWISNLIALLRTQETWQTGHDQVAEAVTVDPSVAWLDGERLLDTLRTESKKLDEEVPISRFSPFIVQVSSQIAELSASEDAEDGFAISASITSQVDFPTSIDDVRVCLTNGDNGDVWFTSGKTTLQPGVNEIKLSCASAILPGQYVLDVSQIRLGKVIFQLVHLRDAKSTVSAAAGEKAGNHYAFVTVPEDGDALDATLEWAPHVFLDRSRTGILTLATGRNVIDRLEMTVKMTSSDKGLRGLSETIFKSPEVGAGTKGSAMEIDEDKITLTNLKSYTQYVLLLPFHEINGISDGVLPVTIAIQYFNKVALEGKTISPARSLRQEFKLPLGLPLGVNVQDFFRHDRLLSKFLISAGATGPLCLAKVELWSEQRPEESIYEIETPQQDLRNVVSLSEPASFTFVIRKRKITLQGGVSSTPLSLTLVYRTAHEEALDVLLRSLEKISSSNASVISTGLKRCVSKALLRSALTEVDLDVYTRKRQLRFKTFDRASWRAAARGWCGVQTAQTQVQIVELLEQVFTQAEALALREASIPVSTQRQEDAEYEIAELQAGRRPWRKLSLPVEVPTMTMVNAVTLKLADEKQDVRVGVPVEVTVDIETSFAWNGLEEEDKVSKIDENALRPGHNATIDDDDSFQDAQSDVSDERSVANASKNEEKIFASVDVNCDFVNWLLSGVKRTVITLPAPRASSKNAHSAHKNQVNLTLVPLQSGLLTLPSVSIWPLTEPIATETPASHAHRQASAVPISNGGQVNGATAAAATNARLANISSDTFITNEAQQIRILPRHAVAPRETFWLVTS